MRIAVIHSYYSSRSPSGENAAVQAQVKVLRADGHEVLLLSRATDREEQIPLYRERAAMRAATGFGPDPAQRLQRFKPDVVHIHNLFPNIGSRWLSAWDGPVVCTLHNFRPLCANGLLYREGKVCTLCPDGDLLAGLKHACYRNSRVATAPLTLANLRGTASNPVLRRADRIVTLSERALRIYASYGIDSARLAVVPNSVSLVHSAHRAAPDQPRWVAVGRLSPEKGFAELFRDWPPGQALDVIGDGELYSELKGHLPAGVQLLGAKSSAEIRQHLPAYSGLMFPSTCFEGGRPLVVLEALEAGVPVVALDGNSGADFVRTTGSGEVYGDGAPQVLDHAMQRVVKQGDRLRAKARLAYEQEGSETAWREKMLDLYLQAVAWRAKRSVS